MKRRIAGLALLVGVAMLANVAATLAAPRLIHALVMRRLPVNIAVHAPRADAAARTIVRPSPDLLYTACRFDVSERPLHITGPVPASYASLSGFAANTDNFFAVNDSMVDGQRRFDVVLAREPPAAVPPGARVIVAPTASGLVLFRTLIPDEAALRGLLDLQREQRCEPL